MGVDIKLSDRDLPVSPAFIEFLSWHIERKGSSATWHDQLSEALVPARFDDSVRQAVEVSEKVFQHPLGQRAILRSYELLTAFLTGRPEKFGSLHETHHFVCVVGCPRHGGTYLVKELFRALGMNPDRVPDVIAHDGFPNAAPFRFQDGYNALTSLMQQTAEYLAMVEVFFAESPRRDGKVVVPKKATKAAYHGAFFRFAFGPGAEYVITLRHPLAACISTYEKSGGLPEGGKFKVRSNIEEWAQRDCEFAGADPKLLLDQSYFDVYLRYWERYHFNLALTGLLAHRNCRIVVYARESMTGVAREWSERFAGCDSPQEFTVFDYHGRHKDWEKKAQAAIRRVAAVWQSVGVAFPLDEVMAVQ